MKYQSMFLNHKVLSATVPPTVLNKYDLPQKEAIGYFSMEYGLKDELPIYSGGLGVLAGDTLKSAVDLKLPMVAVGVLWKNGYFNQEIKENKQAASPQKWDPAKVLGLTLTDIIIDVQIRDMNNNLRTVKLKVWKYAVKNADGTNTLPLFLLDADHPDNFDLDHPEHGDWIQRYTARLYDSADPYKKIVQRYILGVGGMKLLHKLQKENGLQIKKYHLNEGHAAMAIAEYCRLEKVDINDTKTLEPKFNFTIHTPVAAGLDKMKIEDIYHILPFDFTENLVAMGKENPEDGYVNLPFMGMKYSEKVNAVSRIHGRVTENMFSRFKGKIIYITNGVHLRTWQTRSIKLVLDKHVKDQDWTENPEILKESLAFLKTNRAFRRALEHAHALNKRMLINSINRSAEEKSKNTPKFTTEAITIAYARRFAPYKRADLLMEKKNIDELAKIAAETKHGIQLIFSGKAHPADGTGKDIITRVNDFITEANSRYGNVLRATFLENYNMKKAKMLVAGADVWLNTPLHPMEASGTSGMKAAMNGVIQLSTNDGWWGERGYNTGLTFGNANPYCTEADVPGSYDVEAPLLLDAIERELLPIYENDQFEMLNMQINALLLNSAQFNTHRMVLEYAKKLWHLQLDAKSGSGRGQHQPNGSRGFFGKQHLSKLFFGISGD